MFPLMRTTIIFLLLALMGGLTCTQGQNLSENQNFNSLIDIDTEEIDDYMTFPGSKLTPMVRVIVSYWQEDANEARSGNRKKILYEELWYRAGDPLACSVYHPLGLREGSVLQIRLRSISKPKSKNMLPVTSKEEIQAGANALVRIYFDVTLLCALPTALIVPNDTFGQLTDALADENFFDSSKDSSRTLDRSIMLPLITEDHRLNNFLCYGNPNL